MIITFPSPLTQTHSLSDTIIKHQHTNAIMLQILNRAAMFTLWIYSKWITASHKHPDSNF